MKKIKSLNIKKIICTLAAGAALITVTGTIREGVRVEKYSQLADEAYCTVLVYMDGSDLESGYGAATDDLEEMENTIKDSGMAGDTLHVVVEAGGTSDWKCEEMRDSNYGRFIISENGISNVEKMEARNMGRSDTLADFINYGTQSYPAKHYGLVLWNHGAGQITGFGSDSNFEGASMSLEDIKNAIELSDMKEKFDFISLDACLMSSLELVSVLENKTHYLIASEELEPQNGYDYAWLETIGKEEKNNSDSIGENIGKAMLETYETSYSGNDYKLTLSLIDVDAYEKFHTAFHRFIESVLEKADESLYQKLGQKRISIQGFGNRQAQTADIVDAMDLLSVFSEITEERDLYYEVSERLQELVIDRVVKGYSREPGGISLYLPSGSNDWMNEDMEVYKEIGFCDSYQKLLVAYQKYLAQENQMEWRMPAKNGNEIKMQIDSNTIDNIAGAYQAVFCNMEKEGEVYLISTDSDVVIDMEGSLAADIQTQYWGLKGQVLCFIEVINTDDYTEYMAPVLYNNEICTMYIGFDEENPDGIIHSIVPIETTKCEYELKNGDVIVPLYPTEQLEDIDSEYLDNYCKGNEIHIDSIEDGDGELELVTVNINNCLFGFMIQDTKQNIYYTDFAEGKK